MNVCEAFSPSISLSANAPLMAFTHKYDTLAPSSVETGCGKMFSLERIQISIFLLDKFICSIQGQCSDHQWTHLKGELAVDF